MQTFQPYKQVEIEIDQPFETGLYTQDIVMGGNLLRHVSAFEAISHMLPVRMDINRGPITKFEYSAMLFQNMGYTSPPVNPDDWMVKGISVENVMRQGPHPYIPLTEMEAAQFSLTINPEKDTLGRTLRVISMWGRGPIETGYIVDENESFILPSGEEVKHKLANKIMIKRPVTVDPDKKYWSVFDIQSRRLHNMCPHINPEYSYNCIRRFSRYADQIVIDQPWVLFVSALIDPNLPFTLIKNSEIVAARRLNRYYFGYPALRSDYHTSLLFQKLLQDNINGLKNIYKTKGAFGLLDLVRIESPQKTRRMVATPVASLEVTDPTVPQENTVPDYDQIIDRLAEEETVEGKKKIIDDLPLDNNAMNFIFKHVDKESFPEYLMETITDSKGKLTYGSQYYITLTRIYIMLNNIQKECPAYLENDCKWIISKPFFISENAFGLYNQKANKIILAYPDFICTMTDPYAALKLYKERYDKDVLLDADELGDSTESKGVTETILVHQIPVGEENNYIKPDISANLEVEVPDETPEEDVPLTKEEMARILSEKYNVKM